MNTFNPFVYLDKFHKDYGKEIYNVIEHEENLNGSNCILKVVGFTGKVYCLWLPKNNSYRPNHLWLIKWNNNNWGICEKKDLII